MRHRDRTANHLDSTGVLFSTRQSPRRGVFAALLGCLAFVLFLTGCGEDRSNLIPKETSNSLVSKFNQVNSLAADGQCFAAVDVAASARAEIESLGGSIDAKLKRSLLDGVTELQGYVSDPEKCTESDTTTTEEPPDTEETPPDTEGTTGVTGTTDTEQNTTGDQGTTDEDQDQDQQTPSQGEGNGNSSTPPAKNPTTPAKPTKPTTPTTPVNPPSGPGSGGLGPG